MMQRQAFTSFITPVFGGSNLSIILQATTCWKFSLPLTSILCRLLHTWGSYLNLFNKLQPAWKLLLPLQRAPTCSFSSYYLKGDYNPLIHKRFNVLAYLVFVSVLNCVFVLFKFARLYLLFLIYASHLLLFLFVSGSSQTMSHHNSINSLIFSAF